jgi:hypothetical protein
MALLYSILLIPVKSLYMFRAKQSPIIRSSIKLYLQHVVFINRVWPAVVLDESELVLVGIFLELIHDARNDEHEIITYIVVEKAVNRRSHTCVIRRPLQFMLQSRSTCLSLYHYVGKNNENSLGVKEEKKVMPSSSLIECCFSSKLR